MPIDLKSVVWDAPDPAAVQWDDAKSPTVAGIAKGGVGAVLGGLGNLAAGAVRGAGSIGATLLTPIDAGARALGIQNDVIGRTDRREAMTSELGDLGADTNSLAFKGGQLGGEIAGTLGVGGTLAKGLALTGRAAPAVNALRSSGFTTGDRKSVV